MDTRTFNHVLGAQRGRQENPALAAHMPEAAGYQELEKLLSRRDLLTPEITDLLFSYKDDWETRPLIRSLRDSVLRRMADAGDTRHLEIARLLLVACHIQGDNLYDIFQTEHPTIERASIYHYWPRGENTSIQGCCQIVFACGQETRVTTDDRAARTAFKFACCGLHPDRYICQQCLEASPEDHEIRDGKNRDPDNHPPKMKLLTIRRQKEFESVLAKELELTLEDHLQHLPSASLRSKAEKCWVRVFSTYVAKIAERQNTRIRADLNDSRSQGAPIRLTRSQWQRVFEQHLTTAVISDDRTRQETIQYFRENFAFSYLG